MILQSVGRDGTKDISFTIPRLDAREVKDILEDNKNRITAQKVECEENIAKVSIVGAGMMSNPAWLPRCSSACTTWASTSR